MNEIPVREEIIAITLATPVAFLIGRDGWHVLLLIAVLVFILIIELLNTGIEALADKITTDFSQHIKIAKDSGSAAVLLSSTIAAAVWGLSLWDYFFKTA